MFSSQQTESKIRRMHVNCLETLDCFSFEIEQNKSTKAGRLRLPHGSFHSEAQAQRRSATAGRRAPRTVGVAAD